MTAADWRKEANDHEATILHYRDITASFIQHAVKYIPCESKKYEAEEIYGLILAGIERLARDRDTLLAANKGLRMSLASNSKEGIDIQDFAESAIQHFPKLHKIYQVSTTRGPHPKKKFQSLNVKDNALKISSNLPHFF
jgi:hypothetical protein